MEKFFLFISNATCIPLYYTNIMSIGIYKWGLLQPRTVVLRSYILSNLKLVQKLDFLFFKRKKVFGICISIKMLTISHVIVFLHQNLEPDFTIISWFCVHTASFLKSDFKFMTFLPLMTINITEKYFCPSLILFFFFCLFIFC